MLSPAILAAIKKTTKHVFSLRLSGRFSRELCWVAAGQAIATLGAFIGVRLFTEAIAPAVYGEFALGMTVAGLVTQLAIAPLINAGGRFFAAAREAGELRGYLRALLQLLLYMTSGLLVVIAVLACGLTLMGKGHLVLPLAAPLGFAIISGLNSICDSLQNAGRQRVIVAWHQALGSWSRFIFALALITWLPPTSPTIFTGYIIAASVILCSQTTFLWRSVKASFRESKNGTENEWRKKLFAYAWPFATWASFTWAQAASDRWALQWFATPHEVGLYAVLQQVGFYPVIMLTGLLVQLTSPILFEKAGDATDPVLVRKVYVLNARLTAVVFVATILGTIAAYFGHSLIFGWITAGDYRSVSWLLPGVVLAAGLMAVGQFSSISLMSGDRSRLQISSKIGTAAIAILCNMIGAAWLGVEGLVASGILTGALYSIWTLRLVRGEYNRLCK